MHSLPEGRCTRKFEGFWRSRIHAASSELEKMEVGVNCLQLKNLKLLVVVLCRTSFLNSSYLRTFAEILSTVWTICWCHFWFWYLFRMLKVITLCLEWLWCLQNPWWWLEGLKYVENFWHVWKAFGACEICANVMPWEKSSRSKTCVFAFVQIFNIYITDVWRGPYLERMAFLSAWILWVQQRSSSGIPVCRAELILMRG